MTETLNARFSDGQTALEHRIEVRVSNTGLAFAAAGMNHIWPAEGLLLLERAADRPRVAHESFGEARIVFDDAQAGAVLNRHLPDIMSRSQDRLSLDLRRFAMFGGTALALAVVVFLSLNAIAGLLTTLVPLSYEKELGEQTLTTLDGFLDGVSERCETPEGLAALDRMTTRLTGDRELRVPVEVRVVPVDMVNAIALPGGFVLIFEGLLKQAGSAEEVAGVLAHEIGHTQYRHGMQRLIWSEGLAILINIVSPGDLGRIGRDAGALLLSLSYSRDAEREADDYAIDNLNRIGVTSAGMAEFFERAGGLHEAGETDAEGNSDVAALLKYLSTHPDSAERVATIRAEGKGTGTILSDPEWDALRTICGPDDAEE
ncbi:M48 family metallopeptidase [Minwuia sp.]|uniref:M48 family metallopeptidase n=1 Tax=Minwuia sp. TaxID=2493630 RepID=UPI003A93DE61